MSTRHLVDPDLLPTLDVFPQFEFDRATLSAMRAARQDLALPVPDAHGITIERRRIAGVGGHDVGIIIFRPEPAETPLPAVLHIHGGGYVMGTAEMSSAGNAVTADAARCVIVSVDYRLAPETPHPGPLEDCYAALKWLHDGAEELGVDRTRIAVAGESAGGGLAAALALLARDRGEVPLIFQRLIYPMIDDRTCVRDAHPYVGEFIWTPASNRFGWHALLGEKPGGAGISPYAAAARAEDLAGLPPAYISVGSLDLFLEENVDYALRLTRAGVPVELHVYPGAFHGFELAPNTRLARVAARDRLEALKRALYGAG
ncbi:alpha/beta hydrolase [Flavisphingomonas formosensis]|uniref:alpha/beta hydrolase n=1 Tax=Flavisphingomonas formosensis TaxID=861534 RepID=UPI0012FC1892|nr:alpha/beta hydrolase [Sphingomonas formosensis]